MKKLQIAHMVTTVALVMVVASMGYLSYRQQELLNELAESTMTLQQIEYLQLTKPCGFMFELEPEPDPDQRNDH
jgi:hypothetical protein